MLQILTRFKDKYKPLLKKGLIIEGMVVVDHARRKNAISVSKPFIFDNRNIPTSFDGIQVKKRIVGEMPKEFQIDRTEPDWHKKEYIWAPERFELFVDRAFSEIKEKLGEADLTKEEALDAICFGNFEEHSRKVKMLVRQGKVPAYNSATMTTVE